MHSNSADSNPPTVNAMMVAAESGEKAARLHTRWFSYTTFAVGLIVTAGGPAMPWPFQVNLVAIALGLLLFIVISAFIRTRQVLPRDYNLRFSLAVASWIAISTIFTTFLPDDYGFLLGVTVSLVAATPFFILALMNLGKDTTSRSS